MAQQNTPDKTIDSLTQQLINGQASLSTSVVMEQVLQAQMETDFQVEKLKLQAAGARTVSEKVSCNLRVKALTILTARLRSVCGFGTTMPTAEEVDWARKHFSLPQ